MYPDIRPFITFRYAHECGQIIEERYYFSTCDFQVRHEAYQETYADLHGMIEEVDIGKEVDIGNIQFINKQLCCAKCGKRVTLPDRTT